MLPPADLALNSKSEAAKQLRVIKDAAIKSE